MFPINWIFHRTTTSHKVFSKLMTLKHLLAKIPNPYVYVLFTIVFRRKQLRPYRYIFKYISQYRLFQKLGGSITYNYPILEDYDSQAGTAKGHYFHQDLLVASFVHKSNPTRHIDVGSRIDGFVAHVASFRKIEVMDVRQLESIGHQNISFLRADLMDESNIHPNISDSISCLHAIEHFGLGRYGDPLDPNGHIKGFNNILRMLQPNGILYISFPIGRVNETQFNGQRVFHPNDILRWPDQNDKPDLVRFDYVDDEGNLHQNVDLMSKDLDVTYGCGIYTFRKSNLNNSIKHSY